VLFVGAEPCDVRSDESGGWCWRRWCAAASPAAAAAARRARTPTTTGRGRPTAG